MQLKKRREIFPAWVYRFTWPLHYTAVYGMRSGNGFMLYLGFGTGLHIDIFNNGTVNGFSPADAMVGIKTP
jgi:hypothetical protein